MVFRLRWCGRNGDGFGVLGFGLCGIPRRGNRCARFVLDGVVPAAEVKDTNGPVWP